MTFAWTELKLFSEWLHYIFEEEYLSFWGTFKSYPITISQQSECLATVLLAIHL